MNDLHLYEQQISEEIYLIRGEKVMLDQDFAELNGVVTKVLKQAVRRNISTFPEVFMFELTQSEFEVLRSPIVTSNGGTRGGARYLPFCFTEPGVAMLSSILNSERAIKVDIQIIRIFVKMRQLLIDNTEIWLDIEKIKRKLDNQDKNMKIVFRFLDELMEVKASSIPRKRIEFKSNEL